MDALRILILIAFRNLFANRWKTLIVGGIVFFGALLVVVGSSLLDSVDEGMSRSIIGSAAGHIQVYSPKSKDELAIFGNFGSESDLEPLDDFAQIKKVVEQLPEVKAVVPMGLSGALVTSGNTIDLALEKLRNAAKKVQAGDRSAGALADYEAQKSRVRQMASVLAQDLKNVREIGDDKMLEPRVVEAMAKATSTAFWDGFDHDPLNALEFLENEIAPQATDADLLYVRYIGTDPAKFQQSFDRMEIVDGQTIPPGQRGFLFTKYYYENYLKLRIARKLDKIREARDESRRTLSEDPELQRYVRENLAQVHEIVLQLDPVQTSTLVDKLRAELRDNLPRLRDKSVSALLAKLLEVNDQNFDTRYAIFYRDVAPMVDLYRIRVGDVLTIKAFTKSGYQQSVNVKVWGTFKFSGLEKSALSGGLNLIDLASFRDLYGFLTTEKKEEIARLKSASGARDIDRADAEAALFGSGKTVEATATAGIITEPANASESGKQFRRAEAAQRVYGASELQSGVILSAAVILKDPEKIS